MNHRIWFARARRPGPLCAGALAVLAISSAAAQAPKPSPKAQPKSPAVAAPPAPQQAGPSAAAQTIYSSWTKFCDKGPKETDKPVCFISQFGQSESGATAVVATLVEPEGSRKALLLTLPLGVQLKEGMRAAVDQGQPLDARYAVCRSNGCTAEIEASGELIDKLKAGKGLMVQGVDYAGYELSYALPLESFAKAYAGASVTAEELDQQRKLQEDLMRRAAEARKRNQPPAAK
jgi:invasion protein IalB